MILLNLFQKFGKAARRLPPPPPSESVPRLCARLLGGDDGQKLLAALHDTINARPLGADASEAALRYREGQRALLAQITRLAARGRAGN